MRSLRSFGFALMWLVLFEIGLRLYCAPDARTVRDPEHPYGCFADDELAQLVAVRAADVTADRPAGGLPVDVVLLGDSVLAGVENAPGQRLADALRTALKQSLGAAGPPSRVWTLAAGGARASDVYGMLRRALRALRAGPRGTRGVLVVVSSNVIFFSQRHRQPAMAYPCLAPELRSAAADAGIRDPELQARLLVPGAGDSALARLEHRLLHFATEHLYLLQQRRRLAEALFGGPPRLALRERLQLLHRPQAPQTPADAADLLAAAGPAVDRAQPVGGAVCQELRSGAAAVARGGETSCGPAYWRAFWAGSRTSPQWRCWWRRITRCSGRWRTGRTTRRSGPSWPRRFSAPGCRTSRLITIRRSSRSTSSTSTT